MRIAICQPDIVWEDRSANFAQIEGQVEKAAAENCQLFILPEMFSTGFSFAGEKVWEAEPAPSGLFMARMAQKYQVAMLGSYSRLLAPGQAYNMLELYDVDGCCRGQYAKCHLFSHNGEDQLHVPGDGPRVFSFGAAKIGAFVCFDLRFPEQFRLIAREMNVAVVVASWPASRRAQWDVLLEARALENQCYVIGVNRTGYDGRGVLYDGGSVVIGPNGAKVLPPQNQPGLFICDLNLPFVDEYRSRYKFLEQMRFIG